MKTPPRIIELVGPAGAGKSTLLHDLSRRHFEIRKRPRLRKLEYLPLFVHNALVMLPGLIKRIRINRCSAWQEFGEVLYLKVLHHVLGQQFPNGHETIIFDQGPVFLLSRLRSRDRIRRLLSFYDNGKSMLPNGNEDWLSGVIQQWSATLDTIIWLDAPNEILQARIRLRKDAHIVKNISEQQGREFLMHYRTSYEQVLAAFESGGSTRVLRFNTGHLSREQLVEAVVATLDLETSGRN